MSEVKKFTNISTALVKKIGVQALADRPNVRSAYGNTGLSAAELKAHFDKMVEALVEKLNSLQDSFAKEEIAQYIRIVLDEKGVGTLQDLVDAIVSGKFAEDILRIYETDNSEDAVTLKEAFRNVNKKIADEIELVNDTFDELRKLIADGEYGFSDVEVKLAEDGNRVRVDVDVIDEGETRTLVFTFYNFGKWDALSLPLVAGEEDYTVIQQAPSLRKNNVLSQSSVALGENCVAGCMGYYISEIYYGDSSNNPQIRVATSMPVLSGLKIASSPLAASSSFTAPKYSTGAKFNITCGSHYFYIGTIKSINRDVITFTGDVETLKSGFQSSANSNNGILTSTSFHVLIPGTDDYTMCVPAQPTVGAVSVSALAFTEGSDNKATGMMSHAEGRENIAGGAYGHAEGRGNIAGYGAHAEGYLTQATEKYAHSEGWNTKVTATAAHAEGRDCEATAHRSHAEGWKAKATAVDAHAEGRETIASGGRAHAEGYLTEASGQNSHAGGWGTKATELAQTAIGKWNKENPDALFIVGNGTSNTARSNAFEVLKDGTLIGNGTTQIATGTFIVSRAMPAELNFDFYPRLLIYQLDDGTQKTIYFNEGNEKTITISYVAGVTNTATYMAIGNNVPFAGKTTTLIIKDTEGNIIYNKTTDVVNPYISIYDEITYYELGGEYYAPIVVFNGVVIKRGDKVLTPSTIQGIYKDRYSLSASNDGNGTSTGDIKSGETKYLTAGQTYTYYLVDARR